MALSKQNSSIYQAALAAVLKAMGPDFQHPHEMLAKLKRVPSSDQVVRANGRIRDQIANAENRLRHAAIEDPLRTRLGLPPEEPVVAARFADLPAEKEFDAASRRDHLVAVLPHIDALLRLIRERNAARLTELRAAPSLSATEAYERKIRRDISEAAAELSVAAQFARREAGELIPAEFAHRHDAIAAAVQAVQTLQDAAIEQDIREQAAAWEIRLQAAHDQLAAAIQAETWKRLKLLARPEPAAKNTTTRRAKK